MIERAGREGIEAAGDAAREKFNVRDIVRVVVSRPKSTDDLRVLLDSNSDFDLRNLKLTTQMWAEKSKKSEVSAGQAMPVGGGANPGESTEETARRELFEETHLQPVGGMAHLGQMEYDIVGKKQTNRAQFVGFRILPADTAFQLHEEEDKIGKFHYLDLDQLEELLTTGRVIKQAADRSFQLIGSLREEPTEREVVKSLADQENVRLNIAEFAVKMESQKKLDVIRRLIQLHETKEGADDLVAKLENLSRDVSPDDHDLTQKAWEKSLIALSDFVAESESVGGQDRSAKQAKLREKILAAVDLSNFAEEIDLDKAQGGAGSKVEAVMRLMFNLLETRKYGEDYLRVAGKNEYLKDTVAKINKFFTLLAPGPGSTENKVATILQVVSGANRRGKQAETGLEVGDIEAMFCQAFGMTKEQLYSQLNNVDDVLHWVEVRALDPKKIGGRSHKESVKQINEITGANLTQLLELALPSGNKIVGADTLRWKKRLPEGSRKRETTKRIVFEARRKLSLLFLLSDAAAFYESEKMRQVGNYIENGVYEELTTLPGYECEIGRKFDADGALENVSVQLLEDSDATGEIDSRVDQADEESITLLRKLKTAAGEYFVISEKSTALKEKESFLAKMIIRGLNDPEEIKDLSRRSLLVAQPENLHSNQDWLNQTPVDLPGNVSARDGAKTVVEVKSVWDIIESIARQPGVEIKDYTPTPVAGEKIKSRSSGGAGDVRYAKFYIYYTAPNGELFKEEVQVYSPDARGKSALYHKEKKEEDDARYFLERLFKTKGRNSFVDLLYPPQIYGWQVASMRKKGRPLSGQQLDLIK